MRYEGSAEKKGSLALRMEGEATTLEASEKGRPAPSCGSTGRAAVRRGCEGWTLELAGWLSEDASAVTVSERAGADSGVMVLAIELPVA